MKKRIYFNLLVTISFCLFSTLIVFFVKSAEIKIRAESVSKQEITQFTIFESFPSSRITALLEERKKLEEILEPNLSPPELKYFLDTQKKWSPGQTITVAFNGGSKEVRQHIMEAVRDWENTANIKFDFDYKANSGSFREWTNLDTSYKAYIRIDFIEGGDNGGNWSAIGIDSISKKCSSQSLFKTCYFTNQPSMNFGDFAKGIDENTDWKALVLHEFGHALGLMHELQNPKGKCDSEFRWKDDTGYNPLTGHNQHGAFIPDDQSRNPGIYRVLGGFPSFWEYEKIKANLGVVPYLSSSFEESNLDSKSIMMYYFPPWMFIKNTQSPCYSDKNLTLSTGDKTAVARLYPKDPGEIKKLFDERVKITTKVLQIDTLTQDLKQKIQINTNNFKDFNKNLINNQ